VVVVVFIFVGGKENCVLGASLGAYRNNKITNTDANTHTVQIQLQYTYKYKYNYNHKQTYMQLHIRIIYCNLHV